MEGTRHDLEADGEPRPRTHDEVGVDREDAPRADRGDLREAPPALAGGAAPLDRVARGHARIEDHIRRSREDRDRDLDDGPDRSFDPTDPKR